MLLLRFIEKRQLHIGIAFVTSGVWSQGCFEATQASSYFFEPAKRRIRTSQSFIGRKWPLTYYHLLYYTAHTHYTHVSVRNWIWKKISFLRGNYCQGRTIINMTFCQVSSINASPLLLLSVLSCREPVTPWFLFCRFRSCQESLFQFCSHPKDACRWQLISFGEDSTMILFKDGNEITSSEEKFT